MDVIQFYQFANLKELKDYKEHANYGQAWLECALLPHSPSTLSVLAWYSQSEKQEKAAVVYCQVLLLGIREDIAFFLDCTRRRDCDVFSAKGKHIVRGFRLTYTTFAELYRNWFSLYFYLVRSCNSSFFNYCISYVSRLIFFIIPYNLCIYFMN